MKRKRPYRIIIERGPFGGWFWRVETMLECPVEYGTRSDAERGAQRFLEKLCDLGWSV